MELNLGKTIRLHLDRQGETIQVPFSILHSPTKTQEGGFTFAEVTIQKDNDYFGGVQITINARKKDFKKIKIIRNDFTKDDENKVMP